MNPLWLTAVVILTLHSAVHVEASPLCIKADENKRFCPGPEFEKAFSVCDMFPSFSPWGEKLDRAEIQNNQGIIDICCRRDCTLRTLLNTFCGSMKKGYRLCESTNYINQDHDNGISKQTEATIEPTDDTELTQQHRKQPNNELTSAAMARTAAEVGLSVHFFRGPKCHCKRIIHNRNHRRFSHSIKRRPQRKRSSLKARLRYRLHQTVQHAPRHINITSHDSGKCHKKHAKHYQRNKGRKCRCRRRIITPQVGE